MSRLTGYRVDNQSINEEFRHNTGPADTRPFSERLEEQMRVQVLASNEEEMTFDLTGVDAAVANALRRIMIAEVPTMAIEHVYIEMNSSIIHDEVLAHRLGLVPIKVDPRAFDFKEEGGDTTSANTLVFSLDVTCVNNPEGAEALPDLQPGKAAYTMPVYTSHLVWCPQGDQEERFGGLDGVRPVFEDILLAKLRPGQSIKLECHCQKGVGKDHAKFSPVATASYRLLPEIKLKRPLSREESQELVEMCPMKVFDLEDTPGGGVVAAVARPRDCTVCRECIRKEGWTEKVRLGRAADHFIFKVESAGMLTPPEIFREALGILRTKCDALLEILDHEDGPEGGELAIGAETSQDDEHIADMLS
mmetsp:Transcript_44688/g.100888  ORF Transcript_44688/g.100888 Transcript_44688/m.100888 type:complete len:362 (+) Transcript_44688:109-1194(+)|eukprot:CAMPEP_0172587284 /NCGR_PEP_ID=MMETSP1068-20121228/6360_1 /TAXON_ID=35684 /ORGANISM="Pseudopedinella elastica, Strain CCMP716" /LENGTH=361 /DNA_ID=CAMNT_0013382251 /DNA_START=37 /DNA_END=1122 /DNA_ORIENTATION=-